MHQLEVTNSCVYGTLDKIWVILSTCSLIYQSMCCVEAFIDAEQPPVTGINELNEKADICPRYLLIAKFFSKWIQQSTLYSESPSHHSFTSC